MSTALRPMSHFTHVVSSRVLLFSSGVDHSTKKRIEKKLASGLSLNTKRFTKMILFCPEKKENFE